MSRRRKRQQRQALINFAMIAAIVAGVIYIYYTIQPAQFDEDTLCLVSDELPPHTAIIIDKTDEYSEIQADQIGSVIRRTRNRLDVGERLTLFELDAQGRFDPRGAISLCNPGRGAQVNALFANPKQIEERYETLFSAPMESVLADLVVPKEAPNSPIMEALARLAQTEAFSDRAPARHVVLISDMLQNSDIFSAYGGGGAMPENMPDWRDTADAITSKFGTSLNGVTLEIRLIPRDRYIDLQRGALKQYWNNVLGDLGVKVDWRDL